MADTADAAAGPQPSPDTTGPPPAIEPPTLHGLHLFLTASACLISVFLDQSTNGAATALQSYMVGSTGASVDEGRWIVSLYLLPYFVMLLFSPYLMGRFGRSKIWTGGHLLFAVACIGIAMSSDSYWSLLFWRFVLGVAQGTFFVCAVSTIITIFPQKIAFLGFAIFAGMSLSGAAAGSAVGGYFNDINAWTSMYVVLALLALAAGVTVYFTAPDTAPIVPREPFDGFGLALALVTSTAFTYLVQFGERDDWLTSPAIAACFILFLATSGAFVLWEGFLARSPFLDLRIFTFYNLRLGVILGFVLGVPLLGGSEIVAYLQTSLHFSPSLAGGELAVRIAAVAAFVPPVAYILGKKLLDPRIIIMPGFALVAMSYVLQYYGTTTSAYFGTFVVSTLCAGAGFAMLFSPIASTILATLPQKMFTRGIGIFKFVLVGGGVFATAALQIVVDHRTTLHATDLGSALQPGVPTFDTLVLNSHAGARAAAALAPLLAQQSTTLAYADSFLYTAIVVIVTAPLALALRPPK